MEITVKTAQQLRLTEEEFEMIKKILGRLPNFNELCAFSGMWSEHCSYKNSIKWLKTLPREGGRMLVKAGEENAGLMDIGDGLGVVFKIDSHTHLTFRTHFRSRTDNAGSTHILHTYYSAGLNNFKTCFQKFLFLEGITNLHCRQILRTVCRDVCRSER